MEEALNFSGLLVLTTYLVGISRVNILQSFSPFVQLRSHLGWAVFFSSGEPSVLALWEKVRTHNKTHAQLLGISEAQNPNTKNAQAAIVVVVSWWWEGGGEQAIVDFPVGYYTHTWRRPCSRGYWPLSLAGAMGPLSHVLRSFGDGWRSWIEGARASSDCLRIWLISSLSLHSRTLSFFLLALLHLKH